MTPDQFDRALDALIAALRYGLKAVKRTDEVDSEGLLAWLASVRREHRGDATSLREVLEADRAFMNRLRLQRLQETDPWDLLDIDWARYPVVAREVLDDPSDWSLGDDFSPHGNDTGADIFADWSRYRRDRPLQAVHRLFGEPYISKPPEPSDKDRWWVWVEIHLALAFGHIKMAGTCPADLAGMTLEVLARERGAAEARADWPHRDEWLGRLERYDRILARFAE